MSKAQVKQDFPIFLNEEISPDENDYSLNQGHIFSHHFIEYFDTGEKIVSVIQKNKYLSIQAFTSSQVNLFFDIDSIKDINFIEIIAPHSPVFINGVFHANKAIKIKAESLTICRDMVSGDAIEFDVTGGAIIFEKLLKTDFLSVSADKFENLGHMQIGKLANFSVKNYVQSPEAETEADGAWCFSGNFCQLAGQFAVHDKFYLKTSQLILGEEGVPSSIIAKGNLYLSADDIVTRGETLCEMKQNNLTNNPNIIVNSLISLNKSSKLDVVNAKISLDDLDNIGDFQAENCEIAIRHCTQKNKLDFKNSSVSFEDFVQKDHALTQISEGRASKKFTVKYMDVDSGQFIMKNTKSFGQQWNIRQGDMLITDSDVGIAESLFLYDPARAQLVQSNVQINQTLLLNGAITFNGCKIGCQSINAQGSAQKSFIQDSHIESQKDILLWKNLQIDRTRISSYRFSIKGELQADQVELNITADATWQMTGRSIAKKIQLLAGQINFTSPETLWEQPVCFSDSYFKAKVVNHKGVTQFLDSQIHGCGEDRKSHSIQGHMRLDNSQFYTDSQTYHYEKSKTSLENKSLFQSGIIVSQGKIGATQSKIASKFLLQDKAELETKASSVIIEDSIYSRDSRLSIADDSEVIAGTILSKYSQVDLGKSKYIAKKSLIADPDSKLSSAESFIEGPRILFAGSVQLSKTNLKGQDLMVFNQFTATDGSIIEIEKEMHLAWKSIFNLQRSRLSTAKLTLSGDSTIDDSQVQAEQVETKLLSKTALLGNTLIKSQDIVIKGDLETHDKEIKINNNGKEEPKALIPQLIAENKLEVDRFAHISGDSLVTDSEKMTVKGEIKLSDKLIAKGKSLTNEGHIEAKNQVFLGFDRSVTNYEYIGADDVIIHSNLFNIFGRIRARDNFTNSGFFSLNLGVYQSPNTVVNSLISFNGGLILPDFSKGLSSLFNPRNIKTALKIALSTALPGYANLINLGFNLHNIYEMRGNYYDLYQKIKDGELTWNSMSKLRAHELMPKICQIKSSTMFLYNACKSTSSEIPDFNWVDFGKQMISTLGGSYVDESIVHVNMGLSATHNAMKTNFVHLNGGAELTLQSNMINTHFLANSGISYADQNSLLADQIINEGSMNGLSQFSITADTLMNSGSLNEKP